jgi:adenine deaminase
MSHPSFEDVRKKLIALAVGLGVTLAELLLEVAFLPLPVIPHLKITNLGLVDVDRFEFVRD